MLKPQILTFLGLLNVLYSSAQQSYDFTAYPDSLVIENHSKNITDIQVFHGYLTNDEMINKNAIIGKTKYYHDQIIFYPLVPFSKDFHYTVLFENNAFYFKIGLGSNYSYLAVDNIFPEADEIPQNILKFHIQFNQSVNTANIYDHIYMLDEAGNKVDRAFLNLGQVLTNSDNTLITLWVEPGRQKRDLGPNKIIGPPLTAGKMYTLNVDSSLKNTEGVPMKSVYKKDIFILPPDRTSPDPSKWTVSLPFINSTEALLVTFDEIMDYKSVRANTTLFFEEKEWKGIFRHKENKKLLEFHPNLPWQKGKYSIKFNQKIEDLAANTIARLFDTDVTSTGTDNGDSIFIIDFKL